MFYLGTKCLKCCTKVSKKYLSYSASLCLENSSTVCIVGSGPAGFGIAQYVLKNNKNVKVDMIEKSPVPYGLIRYGVSPDHQDVKNCINSYEKLAKNPNFSFFGNITVGDANLTVKQLSSLYDATVLCTGAQGSRRLGIPGDKNKNVFTSNEFVGWYNGDPAYYNLTPDLSGNTAVIFGVGNVALDCARMLLKPISSLQDTDITNASFEQLQNSKISKVVIVGRRGLLQMNCTRKEMSEIVDIPNTLVTLNDCEENNIESALKIKDLKMRKQQRLVKYLLKSSQNEQEEIKSEKQCNIKLLRSPTEIKRVTNSEYDITLVKNKLQGKDLFNRKATPTNQTEKISGNLIIQAIGYDNSAICRDIPFYNGLMLQEQGRVEGLPGVYACGWCKMGAKGVLADTLNDGIATGQIVLSDLKTLSPTQPKTIREILSNNNMNFTTWSDWNKIDEFEQERGLKFNKVREKITEFLTFLS